MSRPHRSSLLQLTAVALLLLTACTSTYPVSPADTAAASTGAATGGGPVTSVGTTPASVAGGTPTATVGGPGSTPAATPAASTSVSGTGPAATAPADGAHFSTVTCWTPNYPGVPQLNLSANFRCGYLTVPQNRSDPKGRTIKIAVAIVAAVSKTPKPDPVLYLTGGPGGTGIVTAMQSVAAGMNADREVIFIDQRGTFHSQPAITCPEVDTFNNLLPTLIFDDPATLIRSNAAVSACRTRWAGQGYDLGSFNTAENAADVADLRVALGIKQWNIYGVSYGSALAQVELRDHRQGIRSVVLDSVVPVTSNLADTFWQWPPLGNTALFQACAAQVACARAFPDLRAEFVSAVRRLTAHPMTVQITSSTGKAEKVIVDGFALANVAVTTSLAPGFMDKLPAAISEIAHGNGTAIAQAAAAQGPVGVVGYGLTYGVFCSEHVAWSTKKSALVHAQAANPMFPAQVLSPRLPQAPDLLSDCAVWNVGKSVADTHDKVVSAVPTLLMSGQLDAVTPKENADEVAADLSHAQVITVPGSGHDVLLWQGRCTQPLMNNFLDDPTAKVDTACVKALTNPVFAPTSTG